MMKTRFEQFWIQKIRTVLDTRFEETNKWWKLDSNSFGTVLTNGNDNANLLNYKFSAIGENFGKKEQYQFCKNAAHHSNKFIFRYTTTKEIYSTI